MGPERNQCPVLIERLLKSPESVMADPPRFEHGLQAPQAHVISRLHYGSSMCWTVRPGLIPTVQSYIDRGRMVFQLGSASFFDFGPVIGCGVL